MTPQEALTHLGDTVSAAVAATLEAHCPGAVATQPPEVLEDGADPAAGLALPAVASEAAYVGGATGGNLLLMPLPAVRALAAAMLGADPAVADPDPSAELTEVERTAAGEAAGQLMSAAAAVVGSLLGQAVKIGEPETKVVATAADASARRDGASAIVSVSIDLLGHACRFVQLVPHAFVVRIARVLDERAAEVHDDGSSVQAPGGPGALPTNLMSGVGVRVAAELGRVHMTIRRAVGLAPGAVVELDRELEDPIDLYVNGRRFATGRLVTLDGDEWAVSIDSIAFDAAPR